MLSKIYRERHTAWTLFSALAVLVVIAWIDYVTGYEISVFLLYAVPIGWVTRSLGLGWGLVFSLLATLAFRWADFASGHHFSHRWIYWERGAAGLINFVFITLYIDTFNRTLTRAKRKVKQLEGILPMCTVCHQIMGRNGRWNDLDTYLHEHTAAEVQRKVCPHCSGAKAITDYSL